MYDPTYATACCIMAVILASTFSLIFPLIGPAVILLLFLTIVGKYATYFIVLSATKNFCFVSSPFRGRLCIWAS